MLASHKLSAEFVNLDPKYGPERRKAAEELIKLYADGNLRVEAELTDRRESGFGPDQASRSASGVLL